MRQNLFIVIGFVLSMGYCSGNHAGLRKTQPGGFVPSLNPIYRSYQILDKAEAKISTFNLFGLLNVTGTPDFERARRELISSKQGDDVIQVSWYLEKEYWLLGTINILHIKATVIKFDP